MSADLRNKLLFSVILGLLIYIALVLYSDWQQLTAALVGFPWRSLPLVLALTLVNYVGRLIRWHWFMQLLGVSISRWDSGRVFGVGMLMVMTPGKAGEFLKSYMIKNIAGAPFSLTAPAVLAERLIDGAAMLLLAGVGLFVFPNTTARIIAALVMLNFIAVVVIIQIRPLAFRILSFLQGVPLIGRFAGQLETLYESSYILFSPRNVLISLASGLVIWAAEGLAYYVVLTGFGVQPAWQTAFLAIFIFCISTVIGAVFALPGGVGGVEGSLVALSVQLLGLVTSTATAAALLVRFCTLWFGVLIGVVSFLLWHGLLSGVETARSLQPNHTSEVKIIS